MVKVVVLGIAQDGGRPQVGCFKDCCVDLTQSDMRYPVALGITGDDGSRHLVEASRHLGEQLFLWRDTCVPCDELYIFNEPIQSVFITHAHFGHIDGLGLFGRETMSARNVNLHTSSSLSKVITETPNWNLMMEQGVFVPHIFDSGESISTKGINGENKTGFAVEPVLVPHRAELSDMHAFIIRGASKSLLFLPDHDTWVETLEYHQSTNIRAFLLKFNVDIALIDATFFSVDELGKRAGGGDQREVPHPPVIEQLQALGNRTTDDPMIYFIHMNHTNPLYKEDSMEMKKVLEQGWGVAQQGQIFEL